MKVALFISFSLLLLVGIVCLQIKLSKKHNKWIGLIIPLICLLFSVMSVISIEMLSIRPQTATSSGVGILPITIPIFIVTNIPTLITLAIYYICREQLKKNLELKKMNIQDLD